MDLFSLIRGSDPITLLIVFVILLVTGGVGSSYVTGRLAAKRGIQGDALTKESNGIEGLTNLGTLQGTFITTLQAQIKDLYEQIEGLKADFTAEVEYSNTLIQELSTHDIPIPKRQSKKEK